MRMNNGRTVMKVCVVTVLVGVRSVGRARKGCICAMGECVAVWGRSVFQVGKMVHEGNE